MDKEKIKVTPEVCSYVDEENLKLILELSLPGVKKRDIQLKMQDDSFSLSAPRKDVEFVTTMSFCCPVTPEKAKANYEDGLLKVVVPFKDAMSDSVKIDIH